MKKAEKINGTSLEYEVKGAGEPLLLISTGPIALIPVGYSRCPRICRFR